MRQVLWVIPIPIPGLLPNGIPVYGFGLTLAVAVVLCSWLAGRRARREGIAPELIQDAAVWIILAGIVGARVVYMIQYNLPWRQFFALWEGGLVFYGSALGGAVGYLLAYWFVLRKHRVSTWRVVDIVAPSVALGLCLGRIGCFLNGCCYGNVACAHCPSLPFPLSSPPRYSLTAKGLQSAAGFTMTDGRTVAAVEPQAPAAKSGLQPGDVLVEADGRPLGTVYELWAALAKAPAANSELTLTVDRSGERVRLKPFAPASAAGVTMTDDRTVGAVEPRSPAEASGLQPGDVIKKADGLVIDTYQYLQHYLVRDWPRGKTDLSLTVQRGAEVVELEPFIPWTLRLHPTQLYEVVSTFLLFLLLTAYYPFRRRPGEVMVLFMLCYAVHRFLNEMLRNDTDPVAFGMTLSQNGSILVFAAGLVLAIVLWARPAEQRPAVV